MIGCRLPRISVLALLCVGPVLLAACHNPSGPDGPELQLPVNVVDPANVNAVSKFNSCVGHPFPQQNSPNSGKNYFWPSSAYNSTNGQLPIYAGCTGTITQPQDDTNDTSAQAQSRGQAFHLSCDNSSTGIRYLEITFSSSIIGKHVAAGDSIAYAELLGNNQTPAQTWQYSSTFDIAVYEGSDTSTVNYFSALSASAFAAWASRGVTSAAQTINSPAPTCSSYNANVPAADIVSFAPPR